MPVPLFPDLAESTELRDLQQEIKEGEEALDAAGFAFLVHLMGMEWAIQAGRMDPAIREEAITRAIVKRSVSLDLEQELETLMLRTPVIKARWPIIQSVLRVHRERIYEVSITTLWPQVEGLFTDLLCAYGKAIYQNDKAYLLNPDGTIRQTGGKPAAFFGLENKLDHCPIPINASNLCETDQMLRDLVDMCLRRHAPDRNAILHGNRVDYAAPKMSAILVLAVYQLVFSLALRYNKIDPPRLLFWEKM